MKVAIVVQRYGADISGGAELHARYVAEHLAGHAEVEVLTTCASDYITWRNERPAGTESVNGVPVRRFPVAREREPAEFGNWSARVFGQVHSIADELAWLDAEGPTSPALVEYIDRHADTYDFFVFFSFRYYHAFHGARAVPGRAILVPTAERDGALGLGIFGPVFRGVRAIMYNSLEERALIQAVSGNEAVPGVIVGIGSEVPERPSAARFRQRFGIHDRFAIYVGRIDQNKGCGELFDFFTRYSSALADGLHLVLIGRAVLPVPAHPRIHHLGFVTDEDKFDAIAAAELLIMPSYLESLSMVALEAWALGKPVLANAACDVLQGQCLRSNAGLFYTGFAEFFETLRTLDGNTALAAALGQNGRQYYQRHYSWPVIERKYTDMLDRLRREAATRPMEPLPGWWARRRRVVEPAEAIVARLPRGAAREAPGKASTRAGQRAAPPAPATAGPPPPDGRQSREAASSPLRETDPPAPTQGPPVLDGRPAPPNRRGLRPVTASALATPGAPAVNAARGADGRPPRRRPMRRRRPQGGR